MATRPPSIRKIARTIARWTGVQMSLPAMTWAAPAASCSGVTGWMRLPTPPRTAPTTAATVRDVLRAVDDPDLPMHEALGIAHRALAPEPAEQDAPAVAEARQEVDRFLDRLGWKVSPDAPARDELAVALATLRRLGWPDADTRMFEHYARAADRLAARE